MKSAEFFLFLATIALAKSTRTGERLDCFATNPHPYYAHGSKTAYSLVYERPKHYYKTADAPDCEPVQLWMLARHGTNYPSQAAMRHFHDLPQLRTEIIRNHEERKNGRLCYADVDNLKPWMFNVTMSDANLLSRQGRADMFHLAKRFHEKYPPLFDQAYSPNLYIFAHTESERTRQSAQAFAEGLFGPEGTGVQMPPYQQFEHIIKPYKRCPHWRQRLQYHTGGHAELFKLNYEIKSLCHNVSRRLGFQYDLQIGTVLTMYDMCGYDQAWNLDHKSPWCAAFVKEELMVLEYLEDLESYYASGYGNSANLRLGCMAIQDMVANFDRLEDEYQENQLKGIFYFTHSLTLGMALARLGIASHDAPLRYDNYHMQVQREWRSSNLTPFAGNLAAVFYKCDGGDYNKVMFYLNERRIDYPGCELGLCSWSEIRIRLSEIAKHCDLEWCGSGGTRLYYHPAICVLFIFLSTLEFLK